MESMIHVGSMEQIKEVGAKIVKGGKHGIAVFYHQDKVYAIDNRCPHLGFPLHMGSLCDGMLTCHWHHARFDIQSGGTLDPWADDVTTYPVELKENQIWLNPVPIHKKTTQKLRQRLREGLEQNISIVIAKAIVGLIEAGEEPHEIASIGIQFGTTQRRSGWRSGLTILTAMTNILPILEKNEKILALYHGLVHVARESAGSGTRFLLGPLPSTGSTINPTIEKLSKWYRESIEVRDTQGAERILLTAIQDRASIEKLANMMMTPITDHFYMNIGHTLDFHNKAFEVLKYVPEEQKQYVLASLLPELSSASRSEESHSWQSPINLVKPLQNAFDKLTEIVGIHYVDDYDFVEKSLDEKAHKEKERIEVALVDLLLEDRPLETISCMLEALKQGMNPRRLAQLVALAAGKRVARFHKQNEFRDWITVLHTFTHAHAVHQALRRSTTIELTRAIFHAAMSIYLDRFLNTPAAKWPKVKEQLDVSDTKQLLAILDKQQQTEEAAEWVITYLKKRKEKQKLFNALAEALLREDADFHTYQMLEAAIMEHNLWEGEESSLAKNAQNVFIVAATRYLAAHAPTSREMPHTAKVAMRLHRGEKIFEEEQE